MLCFIKEPRIKNESVGMKFYNKKKKSIFLETGTYFKWSAWVTKVTRECSILMDYFVVSYSFAKTH